MLTTTVNNDSYSYTIVIPIYFQNATRCVARSVRTAFQSVQHAGQAEKKALLLHDGRSCGVDKPNYVCEI
jgi:hypothetical protein